MRARFSTFVLLGLLLGATACKKKLTAAAIESSPAAVVQQSDLGKSAWIVGSDGAVHAALEDPDGKPIAGTVTGQVTFASPTGSPSSVPIAYDPKTGVVSATGPKLDADLTPVSYALTVDGKPWTGTLDVPRTGTQGLADDAKPSDDVPAGMVGPNGGVVQVVGPDRVEVVANKSSGEVRAYVLDANNQVVDPSDRTITIALEGDEPEVVTLAPAPAGRFVVGRIRARVDPVHVTVAVRAHGKTHVRLVGWEPGGVVVVGRAAPRVHLLVDAWPGAVVEVHGHHGEIEGPAVVAPGVVVGGPRVMIGGPDLHVHGGGFHGGGHHGRH